MMQCSTVLSRLRAALGVSLMAGLAAVPAVVGADAAAAATLVPHRALYKLSTHHVDADGPFVAGQGLFTIEINRGCDGWTLNQRIRIEFSDKMGNRLDTDSHFASFEASNGESFTFEVRNLQNGVVVEEFSGSAETKGVGGPGTANFRKPDGEVVQLPEGTLFPVQYNNGLLKRMVRGEKIVSAYTFDGGGLDSAYEVNAIIGKPMGEVELTGEGDLHLAKGKTWPVRLAYFPVASADAEPMIEIDVDLLENGVSPSLVFDYGYIALKATLTRIEALDVPKC